MDDKHYPSLELCKKLTEIGFPQTENFWTDYKFTQVKETKEYHWTIRDTIWTSDYEYIREFYLCPSVMEMLDVIPKSDIIIRWNYPDWRVIHDSKNYWTRDEFLPNALAEMVLWLNDNNYISFKENLQ